MQGKPVKLKEFMEKLLDVEGVVLKVLPGTMFHVELPQSPLWFGSSPAVADRNERIRNGRKVVTGDVPSAAVLMFVRMLQGPAKFVAR